LMSVLISFIYVVNISKLFAILENINLHICLFWFITIDILHSCLWLSPIKILIVIFILADFAS